MLTSGDGPKEGGGGGSEEGDLLMQVRTPAVVSRGRQACIVWLCTFGVGCLQFAAKERARQKQVQDDREKKAYDARVDKKVRQARSLPHLRTLAARVLACYRRGVLVPTLRADLLLSPLSQICPVCKTEQTFAEWRDKKMRCQRESCGGYRFKNKVSWVRACMCARASAWYSSPESGH